MISETVRCRKNAIVPKHPDHRTGPIVQWSAGLLSAAVTQSAAEEPDDNRADGRNHPQENAATPRESPWHWLSIERCLLRHARRCCGHVRILALSRAALIRNSAISIFGVWHHKDRQISTALQF